MYCTHSGVLLPQQCYNACFVSRCLTFLVSSASGDAITLTYNRDTCLQCYFFPGSFTMKSMLLFVTTVLTCVASCASAAHVPDISSVKSENVSALSLLAAPTKQFFQLQAKSNGKCLKLTSTSGTYVSCTDQSSTIYFLNGDQANNHNIVILGSSQCLDREHCHSSSSNLRYSSCDHCGAIHWDIRSDGSLREDKGKNCIYTVSSTQAAVRHCSDGFESFNIRLLGDRFLLKSPRHGDCVSGGEFVNCDCAPTYFITGIPRNYNIRVFGSTNTCLDREHCHSSTSNLRFSECSHCGAVHWSIEGSEIGEDSMKNCINRAKSKVAYVRHCSDGHEDLYYEIIPSLSIAEQELKTAFTRYFRDPNVNSYLRLDLTRNCRGVKIFRYSRDGTVELEVVHFLPPSSTFTSGQYFVQYMVTHIHTNIAYTAMYTNEYILERLSTDPSHVTAINIRYGGVGGPNHNSYDGLSSEFLTNSGPGAGVPLPQRYHRQTVLAIYRGFTSATNNWNQYYESFYRGINFSPQVHISILYYSYHLALYWTYHSGCNKQLYMEQESVL